MDMDFLDEKQPFHEPFLQYGNDGHIAFSPYLRRILNFDIERNAAYLHRLTVKMSIDDVFNESGLRADGYKPVGDRLLANFEAFFNPGNFDLSLRHPALASSSSR